MSKSVIISVGPVFSESFGRGAGESVDSPIAVEWARFDLGEDALGIGGTEEGVFCEAIIAVDVSVRIGRCGICALSNDLRVVCCSAGTPIVFSDGRLFISTGVEAGTFSCVWVGMSRAADLESVVLVSISGLSLEDMAV